MPEPEILSRTVAGKPSSVPAARAALRAFLGPGPRTDDAALIVSELATNAVRHSNSRDGTFELRLRARDGRLLIEVIDEGAATAATPAGEPDESLGEPRLRESGRGLLIVESLADRWGQDRDGARAMWWAELWTEKTGD